MWTRETAGRRALSRTIHMPSDAYPPCFLRFRPMALRALRVGIAAAGVCWASSSNAVAANVALFRMVEVEVLQVRNLFHALNGSFAFGSSLTLVRQGSEDALKRLSKGFQLRIIRVADRDAKPKPDATFQPCLVYLSSVFRFPAVAPDGELPTEFSIGSLSDLGWLTLSKGEAPKPGYFLIVVEPLAPSPPKPIEFLRLEDRDGKTADRYFAAGVRFQVMPGASITPAMVDKALEGAKRAMTNNKIEAEKNDRDHDCVRTTEFGSPDAPVWLADARVCGDQQ